MQKLAVVPLFVAALALAGCGSSGPSTGTSASASASGSAASGAAAPAPSATSVTGTVTVPNPPTPITPEAKLTLSLVDVTQQPNVTVNSQNFAPPQFPQTFRIPFTASAINPNDLYVLQATMQDSGRTYSTAMQQPVLTNGQPSKVDVVLHAEPTASEKMLADFAIAKRATGGMKVKTGTSSKIGESHSWQVFSDVHGIEFVIEQTNIADKGITKTEYAYRNGLPWVVVQEQSPKGASKPTQTERIGWDENGVVVLNQQISGDKTETLSDATAKALHAQSEAEFKRFSKH